MLTRISALLRLMQARGVDCYLIPSTDEFSNEYVPQAARRLAWCTGFTGSNGLAVITNNKCYLYTDGRYLLQAEGELSADFIVRNIADLDFSQIEAHNIGYDPMLHSYRGIECFKQIAAGAATFTAIAENLIDLIWQDRPIVDYGDFYQYDLHSAQRISAVRQRMSPGADFLLITSPDQVCWLTGIRGSDVEYTPLALYYGILGADGSVEKFLHHNKLQHHLRGLSDKVIQIDPIQAPAAVVEVVPEKNRLFKPSPIDEVRLVKTDEEITSMVKAHILDGVAMCNFLYWLSKEKKSYTEYELSQKLLECRKAASTFHYPSFATICGFAENGAIIHYNPPIIGSKSVQGDGLLLLDSGGQYHGGTTDVTRVVPIGKIKQIWKKHYTAVLQGHINLAFAQFPRGATGSQLDGITRNALWANGLDYPHGTGHGVGVFLSVHEGPLRINKVCNMPVVEGAVLSNEPGVYFAGEYGIRLENLMVVEAADKEGFLCLKPLTLVPFDKRLIDFTMLNAQQVRWLNDYHDTVINTLEPYLSPMVKKWLIEVNAA